MPKPKKNESSPLYHGQFRRGLDNSRRVMFPSEWRTRRGDMEFTLIVWPVNIEDYLLVLPPERFAAMLENLRKNSLSNEKVAAFERVLGSTSVRTTLDSVGRLRIPEEFSRAAKIQDEVLFVGRVDKFEIWNPARSAASSQSDKQLAAEILKEITL
jgi:MraZ protein